MAIRDRVTVTDLTVTEGDPGATADLAYRRHKSDVVISLLGVARVRMHNAGPARSPVNVGFGLGLAVTPALGLGFTLAHVGAPPAVCIALTVFAWLTSLVAWVVVNRQHRVTTGRAVADRGRGPAQAPAPRPRSARRRQPRLHR